MTGGGKNLLPCTIQQSKWLTKAEKLFFRTPSFQQLIPALSFSGGIHTVHQKSEKTVVNKITDKKKRQKEKKNCILKTKMPQIDFFFVKS